MTGFASLQIKYNLTILVILQSYIHPLSIFDRVLRQILSKSRMCSIIDLVSLEIFLIQRSAVDLLHRQISLNLISDLLRGLGHHTREKSQLISRKH